jgi:hypothetical protein
MERQKGFILALTLLVMAAIFFFGLLYLSFYRTEKSLALKAETDLIALEAASAGIQDAIYQLKRNPRWNAGFSAVYLTRSRAAYTMSFNSGQTAIPYSTNNSQGMSAVTGYRGRVVPAGLIHLVSVGVSGKSKKVEEALVMAAAGSPFAGAAFVNSRIYLHGDVVVDSFNSAQGTYSQTHQNSGGNIGTNTATHGIVELDGHVHVYGNIAVGTGGGASSISVGSSSTYISSSVNAPQTYPFQTQPTGTNLGNIKYDHHALVTLAPGVYSSLSLSNGSTVQLQPGNYVFTGDINISGNSQLLVPSNGQSILYTNGDFHIGGDSISNTTQRPQNLVVFGGPGTTDVQISGNGSAYMALYAPAAKIEIQGNASVYGALIADSLDMQGDAGIHFDQSLSTLSFGGSGAITVRARW